MKPLRTNSLEPAVTSHVASQFVEQHVRSGGGTPTSVQSHYITALVWSGYISYKSAYFRSCKKMAPVQALEARPHMLWPWGP